MQSHKSTLINRLSYTDITMLMMWIFNETKTKI